MRTLAAVASALTVTATLAVAAPASAAAGCVGRFEYDETHRGMSVARVANWYDTYGDYIGDTADGSAFKRDYQTCWAPEDRRVIVVFSYDDGDSIDWFVRGGEGG